MLFRSRLVHSRAIGASAMIVVDRTGGRAVRVDVHTGVLPHDKELTRLRGVVINKKRGATGEEHSRFFDRLGELICQYVRVADGNYHIHGPVPLDWDEYREKLAFAPAAKAEFRQHLLRRRVSSALAASLVGLGVLDAESDARVLAAIARLEGPEPAPLEDQLSLDNLEAMPLAQRVDHVVTQVIAPVLANDGGKLEILSLDESSGTLRIRFVGSCANCPYSLLSMEQLVKPTLLEIPGIREVHHRARMRKSELAEADG